MVGTTGEVTAVAPGTANITVTTADGSKTAVCAVTVTAASGTDRKTVTFSKEVTGMNLVNLQLVIRTADYTNYTNSVSLTYIDGTTEKVITFDKDSALSDTFKEVTLVAANSTPYSVKPFTTVTFAADLPAGALVVVFNSVTIEEVVTYQVPNKEL